MEEILRAQLLKFMDPMVVKDINKEKNTVKKTRADLLAVDVYEEEKFLSRIRACVG